MLLVRALGPADRAPALAAHDELAADDFDFLGRHWRGQDWAAFLGELERHRRGEDVPPGFVPATFLVGEDEAGVLVGRVMVRHALTDALAHIGGHVGYGVRPGHRGRGHATALLRAGLDVARGVGVPRALVTCADGNPASRSVIERCGGVLASVVEDEGRRPFRRYWIDLG